MSYFTFEQLKQSWDKIRTNRGEDLKTQSTALSNPENIFIKRIKEDETSMTVEFSGLENAVEEDRAVPQVKRIIIGWLKKVSNDVRLIRSDLPATLMVEISKDMKLGEASISVFKRDPKTNKSKRSYKCIGGKKNGRKVADPNNCIGVPDFNKKMKFAQTKRAKVGQTAISRKKTSLTNIMSKRVRKANQRLKKARGF